MSFFSQFLQSTHFRYGTTWRASSSHTFQQICHHRVCYGIFSYASSIRLRKILSKDESFMKSCSHLGNDMFASIKVVTSRNLLSSLKECFAMLYLKVYRQKQLLKYLLVVEGGSYHSSFLPCQTVKYRVSVKQCQRLRRCLCQGGVDL